MGGFAFEQLDGFLDIHYQIAVESGSFQGDGTEALLNHFSTVYTIEIDQDLHEAVKSRFASDPRVIPLLGDSGQYLPRLLDFFSLRPKQKALFWLDAHWSGDKRVNWSQSLWKGYPCDTGWILSEDDKDVHQGQALPSSVQQVPLDREIFEIYTKFLGECILYIDDFDKFDLPSMKGRRNFKFQGEDWSHLDFESLIYAISGRILAIKLIGNSLDSQLIIKLVERNKRMPQLPNPGKAKAIINRLQSAPQSMSRAQGN